MFAPSSRYAGLSIASHEQPGRDAVRYVRRRFLPATDSLVVVAVHVVGDNDRLDRIAATAFGDPERFWQVADGNPALHPEELTARPGRRLVVGLPAATAGVPRGR